MTEPTAAQAPGGPDLRAYEAILFDLDGTLIETDNRWARIAAERLAPLRCVLPRLDPEYWGRKIVMGIETPANYLVAFLERLGLSHLFMGLADRIRRSKGLATREAAELVQGTEPLLEALSTRFKLAVVTTRARPEAMAFVERAQLQHYFGSIVTRQDVLCMKPHPEPVRKAAALLAVAPQRCIMVGDTTMDVLSARRAGAFAVAVLSGFGERKELEEAGADLILDYAVQLLDYLPTERHLVQKTPVSA